MWSVIFLTLSSFAFLLIQQALASDISVDSSIAIASDIAPNAIIDSDLKSGMWRIHPTFGYFDGTTTVDGAGATVASHGFGGTGQAEYSMSDHIGVNFSAMGYSGSGTYTPGSIELGSTGSTSANGWLIGSALVLDPFSGEGFRMPFFLGVNYEHVASSTPTSGILTSLTLSSPGYTFGFSPRFNIFFLRFEPFLVATTPTSKGSVTCAAGVTGACGAQDIQILPVVGVNLIFRPWNLSFYFNLSALGTGVSFYSVGPHLSF